MINGSTGSGQTAEMTAALVEEFTAFAAISEESLTPSALAEMAAAAASGVPPATSDRLLAGKAIRLAEQAQLDGVTATSLGLLVLESAGHLTPSAIATRAEASA